MTTALLRGCDEFPDLIGRQAPEWVLRSEGADFLHGVRCVEFFEWAAKIRLFPWQVDEVMQANACKLDGRWTHSDQTIICSRQNGKSLIAEAVILYRLFVLGHKIVFTAQRWPTAQSIRNRLWARIKSNKKLTAQIVRNINSQGMAEIEIDSGAKVQFSTRSGDAGRGFDKVDLVIFDESYNLDDADIDALLPIQLKAEDPQTLYLSSPVNRETHTFGVKLSELRRRAHDDRPDGWAWSEYAAPEDADRAAVETWALANPSLREGPEVDAIRKLFNAMSEASFDVEILGRGLWFEPVAEIEEDPPAVPAEQLDKVMTAEHVKVSGAMLAIDASPDRSACSVSAGGRTPDGRVWGGLLWHGPLHVESVVAAVVKLCEQVDPIEVVVDLKSPAEVLLQKLIKAGIDEESIHSLTWPEVKSATSAFLSGVDDRSYVIAESQLLRDGFEAARLREDSEGGVAWKRTSGVICQVVATSTAMWAAGRYAPVKVDSRPAAELRTVRRARDRIKDF